MKKALTCLLLACLGSLSSALAAIEVPLCFSDHMVLQRNRPVPIWGTAAPGTGVSVSFAGQNKRSVAGPDGRWEVTLDPLSASGESRELTVTETGATVPHLIRDVLVGEVWLAAGSSTFREAIVAAEKIPWLKKTAERLKQDAGAASESRLRLLTKSDHPMGGTDGWKLCTPSDVLESSVVAYSFAKKLFEDQKVPVGVITASGLGNRIESWMPTQAYEDSASPRNEPPNIDGVVAGMHFERLIRPLIPFALRGVLWSPGEGNLVAGDMPSRFMAKSEILIQSWRKAWNQHDLAFYFEQLAPSSYSRSHEESGIDTDRLPAFQDAQRRLLSIPKTGMAVAADLVRNPAEKWEIGRRLWLWASRDCYGRKELVPSGPLFARMEAHNGRLRLSFDQIGTGLTTAQEGEPLRHFQVSGVDGVYWPASEVRIEGDALVLSNPNVPAPVAARYGWHEEMTASLFNGEKLPASPFCTMPADSAGLTAAQTPGSRIVLSSWCSPLTMRHAVI